MKAFGTLVYLAIVVLLIASCWKIFVKAGKPGWATIVPVYNVIVFLQIIGKPVWWILLMCIPLVNIIIGIICCLELLKKFEQPSWHIILLILFSFIYYPYLGFGSAQYKA